MKKSYLMIAAAALLMTACAQNDPLFEEFEEEAISFSSRGIEKLTRATIDMTWFTSSGNAFGVYGYKDEARTIKLYDDETVTRVGSDWTNPTKRFWDKANDEYNFYAYAPKAAAPTFSAGKFTFSNLSIIKNLADANSDLVVATPLHALSYGNCKSAASGDSGHGANHVEFVFNHILSKLSFKAKTSVASADATIKLKEICIDFASGNATWAQSGDAKADGNTTYPSYTACDGINASGDVIAANFETNVFTTENASGDALSNSAIGYGKTFIVTPKSDGHKFNIRVKYDIVYNDNTTETDCYAVGTISADKYKPKQNESYVITIDINPAAIEFCVDSVKGWTDAGISDPFEVK